MEQHKKDTRKGMIDKRALLVSDLIRTRRLESGFTQIELAKKAGVGLRFLRELEQGKGSLRTDTVNKVLALFGKCLGPVDMPRD